MPLNHRHKTSPNLFKRIKDPGLILRTSAYIMYSNESCDLLTLIRHTNASGYTRSIICTNYSGQSDHSKSIFINENMNPSKHDSKTVTTTNCARTSCTCWFLSFPYKLECCFTSMQDNFIRVYLNIFEGCITVSYDWKQN